MKLEKGVADLSNLFLDRIPPALMKWKHSIIKELNLTNNLLNSIPIHFRHIEKVTTRGNPLLCFPATLRKAKWSK